MELDHTLASRDEINHRMRQAIEEASLGWEVDVTRVELQAIEPPRDIQQSMELQMRAERERRAAVTNAEASKRTAILESEGAREAAIQRPEGERQAAVLRANGLAEARLQMAQAEAEALRRIAAALPEGQAAMYPAGPEVPRSVTHAHTGKRDNALSSGGSQRSARCVRRAARSTQERAPRFRGVQSGGVSAALAGRGKGHVGCPDQLRGSAPSESRAAITARTAWSTASRESW